MSVVSHLFSQLNVFAALTLVIGGECKKGSQSVIDELVGFALC